ncbi:sensor histidine kinase [Fibrella forsythiae]|uniref:histidine kinase n=1 Tax=Fibrella forsythiae TaxID=2817061 RepID=A0ABS3JGV2_9BACT|nr:HAMP domain-containing sensor histidine kinase [Fibrella forsythiae]MBO0948646.1 HAMP domain-containing histidine kinase [Fibrella forsythiae]
MSLRSRIVLAVAAVFAIVSAVAGSLMLSRAERSLQTAFDRATRTRANWLLSMVNTDPVMLPLPGLREQMRVTTTNYGPARELFRSPDFPNPDGSPPVNRRRSQRPGTYPAMADSYRMVTVESSADQFSDSHVSLTLAVPDSSLQRDIKQLRWVFGLGWLVSLVLALGAGYGAAGWLLRPIKNLVGQAAQIGKATRIDPLLLPQSQDELYELTVALNRMLDRIRYTIDTQRHFFGAAAHELRTPLAIMKTGLEVTLNSGRVAADMYPFLDGQLDEVRRLARLIDEFLTLSRPDESPPIIQFTETQLDEHLATCARQLATIAADYEVATEISTQTGPGLLVLTDAVKLDHILLNLLENAIKYAVAGSTVAVLVDGTQPSAAVIRIQNKTSRENGPTIELTAPYFQADPLKEGHGLGLWISHRLTTLLGGQLTLSWQQFRFTSELRIPIPTNQPDRATLN